MRKRVLLGISLAICLILTACVGDEGASPQKGTDEVRMLSSSSQGDGGVSSGEMTTGEMTTGETGTNDAATDESTGEASVTGVSTGSEGGGGDSGKKDADGKREPKVSVSSDFYPLAVKDFFGYETALQAIPERIAVLSGTPLNIWYDLGGKSVCTSNIGDNIRLVEEYKDEILALPSVGPVYSVDMEAVIGNTPQLIITQAGVQSKTTDALRNMNYPVIATLVRTYEDLCDHYRVFGSLLGVRDKAEEKIASFEAKRREIVEKLPAEGKSVVILYLTSGALSVKLDSSIAGDMAKTLKVRNIASNLPPDTIGSENTPLDIEFIVEQKPDLVLVTSMIGSNEIAVETMQKHFSQNQAWQTVEAVREGRVYYLPQQYFLYHSGPYYNEALEFLAKTIYPEIYGEVQR